MHTSDSISIIGHRVSKEWHHTVLECKLHWTLSEKAITRVFREYEVLYLQRGNTCNVKLCLARWLKRREKRRKTVPVTTPLKDKRLPTYTLRRAFSSSVVYTLLREPQWEREHHLKEHHFFLPSLRHQIGCLHSWGFRNAKERKRNLTETVDMHKCTVEPLIMDTREEWTTSLQWTNCSPLAYILSINFYLWRRDNLWTMDKMLVPKVSIIRRFYYIQGSQSVSMLHGKNAWYGWTTSSRSFIRHLTLPFPGILPPKSHTSHCGIEWQGALLWAEAGEGEITGIYWEDIGEGPGCDRTTRVPPTTAETGLRSQRPFRDSDDPQIRGRPPRFRLVPLQCTATGEHDSCLYFKTEWAL